MTGINQGTPEAAIGEPIKLGSNGEFEIEQHPISDRLIIRDTVNGKVAYVRKERGGQIGGDGVLVKALKEGKPMADDGRTYDTIQAAERAANGWVFVPPGTFTESLTIETSGLTLRGTGRNCEIDSQSSGIAIEIDADSVTVQNLSVTTSSTDSDDRAIRSLGDYVTLKNIHAHDSYQHFTIERDYSTLVNCTSANAAHDDYRINGLNTIIVGCTSDGAGREGINSEDDNNLVANCISRNANSDGMKIFEGSNNIFIGNRVINSGDDGIFLQTSGGELADNIIANNRISDSTNSDIDDQGTNTLLDANLTGASN